MANHPSERGNQQQKADRVCDQPWSNEQSPGKHKKRTVYNWLDRWLALLNSLHRPAHRRVALLVQDNAANSGGYHDNAQRRPKADELPSANQEGELDEGESDENNT